MYSPVDKYLAICWARAFGGNGRDSIYVTEVFVLIRELEEFIGAPGLFRKEELAILKGMAERRPLLKLKRLECQKFFLQLVGFDSMEKLLQVRTRTSISALRRLVENYPENVELVDSNLRNVLVKAETSVPNDDSTWFGKWWKFDTFTRKQPARDDKTSKFQPTETENDAFHTSGYPGTRGTLGIKKEEPQSSKYTDLFNKYSNKLPGTNRNISTNSKDRRQQELEELRQKNERYLESRKVSTGQLERLIRELKEALSERDQLIEDLRTRLKFSNGQQVETDGKLLLFRKLHHMLTGQRRDATSFISSAVDLLTLLLTFVVVMNLVKLVYYSFLSVNTRILSPNSNYYYDSDDETIIAFSWLQQLPWLEYKLYQIQDWMGG